MIAELMRKFFPSIRRKKATDFSAYLSPAARMKMHSEMDAECSTALAATKTTDEPEAEDEAPIATHLEIRQEEENARRRESKQKEDDELKARRSDGLPPIVGVCAEHTGDEEYTSFRAGHPYQMWRGRGAIFANGDVIIQWNDGWFLRIPAGNDYSPYVLSYDLNR